MAQQAVILDDLIREARGNHRRAAHRMPRNGAGTLSTLILRPDLRQAAMSLCTHGRAAPRGSVSQYIAPLSFGDREATLGQRVTTLFQGGRSVGGGSRI
jgi:hypothetical protein